MRFLFYFLVISLSFVQILRANMWTYKSQEDWGSISPTCSTGSLQSPINITEYQKSPISLNILYSSVIAKRIIYESTKGLSLIFNKGAVADFDGKKYALKYVNFHFPAEHQIKGKSSVMEMQMVHVNGKGDRLVLVILFDEGSDDFLLSSIIDKMKAGGYVRNGDKKLNNVSFVTAIDVNSEGEFDRIVSNDNDNQTMQGNDNDSQSMQGNDNQTMQGNDNDSQSTQGNDSDNQSMQGNDNDSQYTQGNDNDSQSTQGNDNDNQFTQGNDNQSTQGNDNVDSNTKNQQTTSSIADVKDKVQESNNNVDNNLSTRMADNSEEPSFYDEERKNVINFFQSIPIYNIIPKSIDSFYYYKGSLTTPPCTENVTWVIFRERKTVSKEQLQYFSKITAGNKNQRNVQPIKSILIYRNSEK